MRPINTPSINSYVGARANWQPHCTSGTGGVLSDARNRPSPAAAFADDRTHAQSRAGRPKPPRVLHRRQLPKRSTKSYDYQHITSL